jgi:glycerol-3-phosphate dehydrogenase (NAD(P)+)
MKVTILGAGAFGLALSSVIQRAGSHVSVWGRDPETLISLATNRSHPFLFPGGRFSAAIHFTSDIQEALDGSQGVVVALPGVALRPFFEQYGALILRDCPLLLTTKSIESTTGLFPLELVQQCGVTGPLCVLGGPHFAHELIQGLPTEALIGGGQGLDFFKEVLHSPSFSIHVCYEPLSMQIANALKNIVAIAAGYALGKKQGENNHALHIAHGFAAITQVGQHLQACLETLHHPVLFADFLLTTNSQSSRNTRFGKLVAEGVSAPVALEMLKTVEGLTNLEGLQVRLEKNMPSFLRRVCRDIDLSD